MAVPSDTGLSAGLAFAAGIVSTLLLVLAARTYRQTREANLLFVVAAFAVFTLKSFFDSLVIYTEIIDHHPLELIDTVANLATLFLLVTPILWPRGDEDDA